ncbi:type VI secretion system membrane subunit TssM [Cupriavidus campinensis]
MSNLKSFFSFLWSRALWAAVALVALALVIWFLGPLVAFGAHYPLGDVALRVTAIVMLVALYAFWMLHWPLSPLAVMGACLLLWHLGPLLAFGDVRPLAPYGARTICIVAILLGFALYGGYRLWQAMRRNEDFAKRILRPTEEGAASKQRDELRVLSSIVGNAVRHIRRIHGRGLGFARLLESDRQLYDLPWFMMLGTSEAGKTVAVLNSGLDFPEADQMNAVSLKAPGTTAYCDWWFTNEAVLIDAAGRYADQQAPKAEDAARNQTEWKGFLGLLRKHRPRAPINGAVLTLSASALLKKSPDERIALAATLRTRLAELRQQLGIRFPVYVLVTKVDVLPGFAEHFHALTAEGRAQVWGIALGLPEEHGPRRASDLRERCAEEIGVLCERLEAGINNRLIEEYEGDRRKRLYALPEEFRCLSNVVLDVVALVFMDSRYDSTQLDSALRGVYFSSAMQSDVTIAADKTTLLQRLHGGPAQAVSGEAGANSAAEPVGYRSYFLHNLFQQVIIPEAHLVRPNLRWELRFRAMRAASYLVSILLCLWLVYGLTISFEHNRGYLAAIQAKTEALHARVKEYRKTRQPQALPGVLSASSELPYHGQLDLANPGFDYRYGLYTAPPIMGASAATYASLLRQTLLPHVVRRLENSLDARIEAGDPDGVYSALTAYLMLYDRKQFDAEVFKAWVRKDWEQSDSIGVFGDPHRMRQHLEALFNGDPLAPTTPQSTELVERARRYLSSNPAPRRLYERAMAEMAREAPEPVTLSRAAGAQATSVLTLNDPALQGQGVPGIYTYDGYHKVFTKRLAQYLVKAQPEDAWIMGRTDAPVKASFGQDVELLMARSPLAEEIRRQYLTDYANHWQRFLESVRPAVPNLEKQGGPPVFDLQILRILSSADSPLARLARTAVRETSLSVSEEGDDGLEAGEAAQKLLATTRASSRLNNASRAADAVSGLGGANRLRRVERDLVDNRFAALREVVTGQADAGVGAASASASASSGGNALQLGGIIALLGDQYTRLSVAGTALSANSMPPAVDIGTSLQLEAEKLPAPFRAVLAGISGQMTQKVNAGVGALLASQLESSVGAACRRAIEGKYPFVPGASQDVDTEDFNHVFAADGLLDGFFKTSLAPHVDTSSRPWRYKAISAGMPPVHGPSLEPFERAAAIREAFFREPGAKRMAWKVDARVASLDPEILELSLDIDGQQIRYAHGPVVTFQLAWPGPRGGAVAEIAASPRIRPDTSTIVTSGPWALFRLVDRGRRIGTASASHMVVDFTFDDRHAALELVTGGHANALSGQILNGFTCPKGA